jgi:hypothetical protein
MISYQAAPLALGPGRKGAITPATKTATKILAATLLTASTQNVVTFASQPDVVRVLTVKGNAEGMAGNVVITGKDAAGVTLTDTIALSGTGEVTGAMALKSVSAILLPAKTNGSGDTVSVGTADIFGLNNLLSDTGLLLYKRFNNADDAGSLAVSATVLASNLYTLGGTANGSKVLKLYYFIS